MSDDLAIAHHRAVREIRRALVRRGVLRRRNFLSRWFRLRFSKSARAEYASTDRLLAYLKEAQDAYLDAEFARQHTAARARSDAVERDRNERGGDREP